MDNGQEFVTTTKRKFLPLQLIDAWGKRFHYMVETQNNTFWLASGGSYGKFRGFDQKGAYVELNGQDIILG